MDFPTIKSILNRRGFFVEQKQGSEDAIVFIGTNDDVAEQDLTDCINSAEDETTALGNMLNELGYDIDIQDGKLVAFPS